MRKADELSREVKLKRILRQIKRSEGKREKINTLLVERTKHLIFDTGVEPILPQENEREKILREKHEELIDRSTEYVYYDLKSI